MIVEVIRGIVRELCLAEREREREQRRRLGGTSMATPLLSSLLHRAMGCDRASGKDFTATSVSDEGTAVPTEEPPKQQCAHPKTSYTRTDVKRAFAEQLRSIAIQLGVPVEGRSTKDIKADCLKKCKRRKTVKRGSPTVK
jgi:hypothetical protein